MLGLVCVTQWAAQVCGDELLPGVFSMHSWKLAECIAVRSEEDLYQVDVAWIQRLSAAASSSFSHIKARHTEAINHVLVYCFGLNAF